MAPNQELVKNFATYGDLSQRDVYFRNATQVIKDGAVENYFYHLDLSNASVEMDVTKVSYDTNASVSMYELFTKTVDGNVSTAANAAMLEITTDKTYVRSAELIANDLGVGGNLGVTGDATLSTLSASGLVNVESLSVVSNASVGGTLGVTGATTLSDTLDVTGQTTLSNASVGGTLGVTGAATLSDTLDVTGATTLTNVTATGAATLSSTLDVTGQTTLSNASVGGDLDVTGATTLSDTLDVTGATTLTNVTATGTLDVTGQTTLSNASVGGDLDVTGDTTLTSTLLVEGNATLNSALTVVGLTTLDDTVVNGNLTVDGTAVELGNTALTSNGDVTFNGTTTISNLILGGESGFSGNIDMGDNYILNLSAAENDNVRVAMDGSAKLVSLQTRPNTASTFSSQLIASQTGVDVYTGLAVNSGNLRMQNNEILHAATLTGGMTGPSRLRFRNDGTAQVFTEGWTGSAWQTNFQVSNNSAQSLRLFIAQGETQLMSNVSMTGAASTTVQIPSSNVVIGGKQATFGNVSSATDVTVWGNLNVKGTATNTRIESELVQIGDKNVELGYLEINTLGNLDGAGLTIGGPGGAIAVRPTLVYSSADDAWMPNIDFITKGTETASMNIEGFFVSSLTSDANVFTKVDSSTVNFSDKWRFAYDSVGDVVNLEHYENSAWTTKFTYAA